MIRVLLACGCAFESDGSAAPYCHLHHEGRVQTVNAPPPRFTGTATGPLMRNP